MNKVLFYVFFFFQFNLLIAQELFPNSSLTYSFGINRMDFFSGISYARLNNQYIYNIGIEVGVNKTFFQKRIFPRISASVELNTKKGGKFKVTPIINYSFSIINLNSKQKDIHSFNELYGGYVVYFGNKLKVLHSIQGGLMNERFQSNLLQGNNNVFVIGYFTKVGLNYEF